jgi:hypothetical protein
MDSNAAPIEPSSLDRFLWDRASSLFNLGVAASGGVLALLIVGGIHTLLGLSFLIAFSNTAGAPPHTAFGVLSAVFGTVGPVLLGLGIALVQRKKGRSRPEIKLTTDGVKLVLRIMSHIGWANPNPQNMVFGMARSSAPAQFLRSFGLGLRKTATDMLRTESAEILERAAKNYNRIYGLLNSKGSNVGATLSHLKPSLMAASDEAMISIFNQVAMMERVPESSEGIAKQIERDIRALEEVASRVEEIAHRTPTLTESYSSSSQMQSVLENLRLDDAARTELGVLQESSETLDEGANS